MGAVRRLFSAWVPLCEGWPPVPAYKALRLFQKGPRPLGCTPFEEIPEPEQDFYHREIDLERHETATCDNTRPQHENLAFEQHLWSGDHEQPASFGSVASFIDFQIPRIAEYPRHFLRTCSRPAQPSPQPRGYLPSRQPRRPPPSHEFRH
ncbi:hypothetical protein B0H66DRAFT_71418 [Apodospora peruviana]|uniref:Uncharacterized protein n=1 Tax=Apodospora peruviana TaxID=516989 RepID=A0AAE0MFH3_9PEZI|nr:hypothetical protein B0H66DRAFT_71418 [Apodospora peruviana]